MGEHFIATGQSGRQVIVETWTEMIHRPSIDDQNAPAVAGLRYLQTRSGESVERLAKGRYRICATGEILTSDSEDAP